MKLKDKLYTYYINKLGMRNYTRGWLKGNCPYCGREDKFGINLSTHSANCFICGRHGTPTDVVMELENLSTIQEIYSLEITGEVLQFKENPIVNMARKINMNLPEGFHLLDMGDSQYAKSARAYLKHRGFNLKNLTKKGWGYCTEGNYAGYIIIPFYHEGQLIYFNARRYMLNGPRYNNPKIDDCGIGKNYIIYNIDALYLYKRVYLAEGAINAETISSTKGISTGGKKLSTWQISTILSSPIEEIVILLDPDAMLLSYQYASAFKDYKKIKVVELPKGEDINSLGFIKSLKLISKTPWATHSSIYNRLMELKYDEENTQFTY